VPALAGNFLAGLHWKRHRAASCSFKMISFSNINKQYGKQLLFVDVCVDSPVDACGAEEKNSHSQPPLIRCSLKSKNL